jgi:hypothetical protein
MQLLQKQPNATVPQSLYRQGLTGAVGQSGNNKTLEAAMTSVGDLLRSKRESIPSWRLKDEADAKRAALARAEKAEQRVAELEHELAQLRAAKKRWWSV